MKLSLTCPNGPYDLNIRYRGNKILSSSSSFGYCERNIINHVKSLSALKAIPFIERIDPYSWQHYSMCFCALIEQSLNIQEDQKLSNIRTILMELERILSHSYYIKTTVSYSQNVVLHNLIMGIKDYVLEMQEEITGRRIFAASNHFGGINFSISHGNIKLIENTCNKIKKDLKEFYDLFFNNRAIISLFDNQSIINNRTAIKMTGPLSWINGEVKDLRLTDPYWGYQDNEVRKITSRKFKADTNCIYTRLLSIIHDANNSLDIIGTIISRNDLIYANKNKLFDDYHLKPGSYSHKIEAPRGILSMKIHIGEKFNIENLSITSPSQINDVSVNNALNGCKIEQADLVFKSLYLSPMEIDK